jgi:hypothetical protein
MNLLTIFVFVLILVLAYAVYKLMTKTTATVSGFSDGTRMVSVDSTNFGTNANYGYSVWVYIDAWQNTVTDDTKTIGKNILTRCSTTSTTSPTVFNLYLDNDQNNLILLMNGTGNKPCTIRNVKLQKWFNVTMSIYGNTVDLYLDGKLVQTCILAVPPADLNSNDKLYVGGKIDQSNKSTCVVNDGGDLTGYISNVVFKNNYFTPEEAWSIYGDGYSGAGMFSFLHSYKLNFSITNNNQTVGQISI